MFLFSAAAAAVRGTLAAAVRTAAPTAEFSSSAPLFKLRQFKPTSAGVRHRVILFRDHLHKGKPFAPLTDGRVNSTGGRNNQGRITSRGRGGRHKRLYRKIEFSPPPLSAAPVPISGIVERLEHDPNRSATIALLRLAGTDAAPIRSADVPEPRLEDRYRYILAADGVKPGDTVIMGRQPVPIAIGNTTEIRHIPVGSRVCNIELTPGKGGQLCRSAGSSAQLLRVEDGFALIRLPSNDLRLVPETCCAMVGQMSNPEAKNIVYGKAGAQRWLGRRPLSRGVAQNPVDHPHGGGNGRGSGGRNVKMNVFGKQAKHVPTRHKRSKLIVMDFAEKVRQGKMSRRR